MAFDLNRFYQPEEEEKEKTVTAEGTPDFDLSRFYTVEEVEVQEPEEDDIPNPAKLDEYDLSVPKSLDEFANDAGFIESIEEYGASRYGKTGVRMEGESNEEYVERFLTHIRQFENNSVSLAGQLDWMRTATDEEKQNFGYIYSQMDRLPAFYETGGGSFARGVRDYAFSFIGDPLTLIGFGAGKLASVGAQKAVAQVLKEQGKDAAIAQAKKLSMKAAIKPLAVGTALEATGEAVANVGLQNIEAEAGIIAEEDISYLNAGIVGGITGILGVGGGFMSQRSVSKEITDIINEGTLIKSVGDSAAQSVEAVSQELAENGYQFNIVNGYEVLKPLTEVIEESKLPGSKITQAQIEKETANRVTRAATEIAMELAEEGDEQLMTMINNQAKASDIVRSLIVREDVNSEVISGAIAKAGLTPEQFANAGGASLSDAMSMGGTYGKLGKFIKKIRELDPELAKRYEKLYGHEDTTGFMAKGYEYMRKLDRERRALMVTQIATTARNVATAGMRMGFEGAANFIESSIFHMGKAGNALMDGRISATGTAMGLRNIALDSFGLLLRINDYGGSKEATEALLKYNPRLHAMLDRSLQEAGPEDLSKFSMAMNKLNIVQDQFFRRAVFADAVDKRLRRISGEKIDLETFLASGKALPNDILKDSVEEALAFTFARMPKPGGKKVGDTIGYHFVKLNEAIGPVPLPVGTAAFPFARFMVNAMQFQLDYSPASVVSGIYHGSKGLLRKNLKGISDAKTEAELMLAREKVSKGIVGTAALMSAIKYREENQDSKWYDIEADDGQTLDARPFFPIAPYLAVADIIVKMKNNELDDGAWSQIVEGISGAQMRTGASSYVIDGMFSEISAAAGDGDLTGIGAQKIGEITGKFLGELVGAATTPLRVVNDVVAQFDKDAAIVRDANQSEGMTFSERAVSAFNNKIIKDIPVLQKTLPEYQSPTREAPLMKQSPLVGQLTGARYQQRKNLAESELIDLGYENWEVVPSTGDKTADAFVKKHMGKLVETQLIREIANPNYERLSDAQKKASMATKLKRYRDLAKKMGEIEANAVREGNGYTAFDRASWSKVTKRNRKLADDYYLQRYGRTVMEQQRAEPKVNHLRIGKMVGNKLGGMF
jgi:hypothetical protein